MIGKKKAIRLRKVKIGYKRFLGYEKDFKTNEEEVKFARLIYEFLF